MGLLEDADQVTHKVYFDVEINGIHIGIPESTLYVVYFLFAQFKHSSS